MCLSQFTRQSAIFQPIRQASNTINRMYAIAMNKAAINIDMPLIILPALYKRCLITALIVSIFINIEGFTGRNSIKFAFYGLSYFIIAIGSDAAGKVSPLA